MAFKNYCKTYFTDIIFKQYFEFNGRECRKTFWLFILNILIVNLALDYISAGFLSMILSILIFFPFLGLIVRRFHDIDFSGWWVLLAFIPILGFIALIVFGCIPGTEGENKYGPAIVDVVADKIEEPIVEEQK
ncbi:MAG: DUF805 domain-containing protein [Elusimicrobia bacterium]|nr:DUF805 domain-containing protein [Elusimicrobiota bacterium]